MDASFCRPSNFFKIMFTLNLLYAQGDAIPFRPDSILQRENMDEAFISSGARSAIEFCRSIQTIALPQKDFELDFIALFAERVYLGINEDMLTDTGTGQIDGDSIYYGFSTALCRDVYAALYIAAYFIAMDAHFHGDKALRAKDSAIPSILKDVSFILNVSDCIWSESQDPVIWRGAEIRQTILDYFHVEKSLREYIKPMRDISADTFVEKYNYFVETNGFINYATLRLFAKEGEEKLVFLRE